MPTTLSAADLPRFTPRKRDAHKGDFGRVLIIAGSPGMTGAAALAALAALRAGAGAVTLATPRSVQPVLAARCSPEIMTWPLPETPGGAMSSAAVDPLRDLARRMTSLAIGPGLSTNPDTSLAVQRLVSAVQAPMVVDADGLNSLAGAEVALDNAAGARIITPHAAELGRLTRLSVEQIQAHRRQIAESFAQSHKCIVVLKGAGTVVTNGASTYVNQTGNPGMATAGSGDVLTGMLAGLLAQGFNSMDASCLAVYLHGRAGDLAAQFKGEVSLIAGDIIDCLPDAIKQHSPPGVAG
jgi:hydroxyethylthiazole kinase-like uncharacterized protein yjeF